MQEIINSNENNIIRYYYLHGYATFENGERLSNEEFHDFILNKLKIMKYENINRSQYYILYSR